MDQNMQNVVNKTNKLNPPKKIKQTSISNTQIIVKWLNKKTKKQTKKQHS